MIYFDKYLKIDFKTVDFCVESVSIGQNASQCGDPKIQSTFAGVFLTFRSLGEGGGG